MSDSYTIAIPERFDFSQHKSFTEQSNRLIQDEQIKTVILDFSRTSYLDSSALGMLVLMKKKAKAKSIHIIIRGAKDNAKDILLIANFKKIFEIQD
ncbi:STAS domain-containing protein [Paraglaciecola sp. MB-3u-78]|jgi:anti-anti-sigma factor|uniref:STAS domain-containing protein n=1 Tax=Paraglaciecola sp. MB-3u-78 TaxID=2058332 RepID=UPI000C322ACE|nr:STAS domain-containing protein [Paraglaciecola sp. MB-3u-78]PKG93295.1 anti-sigma factor antagonist [Paraglaciecola sp. MB-3u-78]